MQNRRLLINTIYYTIGEILPRITGFILLPLLTHYLTPAEYGIYSYTNTVMLFTFALSTLSLNTFLLRNYYKEDTPEDRRRIIGNIFVLMLLTNTVISGLELLVFPGLLNILNTGIPFKPYFLLAIVNNFMEGITVIPLIIYRIRQDARTFVCLSAGRVLLQFGLTAAMLSWWHHGLTGVYLARTYAGIPFTLLYLAIIYRNALFKANREQMRKALRFSLPLLPGVLSYLFITTFDRMVLEKNVGLSSLGLYSTAATLALALNVVVQGMYRGFEQKIFEKHGRPEYEEVMDGLHRWFLAALLGAGFLVSLFSREVFLFFTSPQFRPAYRLVPLLIIPVILNGLITFLNVLVIAEQRQTVITQGMFLSLMITIPATLGSIKLWGVYGAILSSGLSFGIVVAYYLYHLRLKRPHVLGWSGLLLLLAGICLGLEQLDLALLPMLLIKTGVAAGYLGLCAYCFRIKIPKWNRAA